MYGKLNFGGKKIATGMVAATLLLASALAAAQESAPDGALAGWLGKEYTVESSTSLMPKGGKLTFVYDAAENLVRACTRNSREQKNEWSMDFAAPCGVTLVFTRGTRYCTADDVKAGDAEVLASCHRLRARDVAMRPSTDKAAVEQNNVVAFLVKDTDDKPVISILVDSPARLTDDAIIVLR